jgi:hypothetical protein
MTRGIARQIDLFKKEKSAEEFLSLLPPDARLVTLPDGSVVVRQGNRTYKVPRNINNQVREVASNVTDLPSRSFVTTGSASGDGTEIEEGSTTDQISVSSGSDFLTNVGGVGATTFDYDLSEADLMEAIELRESAYGVDSVETTTRINADGQEEKGFVQRVGDRLYEIFVSGPSQVITEVSPVSGKDVAIRVPSLEGVASASTIFSPIPGLGQLAGKAGEAFIDKQMEDVEQAQLGVPGFGAVQVQDLSTGQLIDLTASPTGNALTKALGLDTGSVGTFAESTATGPFVTPDGQVFSTLSEAANYVGSNRFISSYAAKGMTAFGDVPKEVDPSRVLDPRIEKIGVYDPDDGTVDLGFSRKGEVTGVAIDANGNVNFKTGRGGFVTGMGEMITTTRGIGFTGLRGDIAQAKDITPTMATDLLSKIDQGTITSTPKTTEYLENIVGDITTPPMTGIFAPPERSPIVDIPTVETTDVLETQTRGVGDQIKEDGFTLTDLGGVTYTGGGDTTGGYTFSETPTTDVYSEGSFDIDTSSDINSGVDQETGDAGFGFGDEAGFDFKKGGEVPKQEGGTTVKPVSQIVQGAGFIAPQQNATDQQTIADDIPMEAEEGDFIINAPAAEFAGRQDIVDMILEAINSLKEKGVDIQYGNPKIPIKSRVQLAVSRNEVYIPKVIAEEIGYDKLEKINNRGKREVERRQKESQRQVNRGGFISKANGGDVEDKSSLLLGTDDSNFLQDLGRAVIDQLGDKIKGFLSRKEEMPVPTPRPKSISPKQKEQDDLKGLEKRPFVKKDEPKYTNFRDLITQRKFNLNLPKDREDAYDLLNLLEVNPKVDPRKGNVPTDTSGFTVGIGFDLGKHDANDLKNFNFSDSLYNKLLPFVSKIGKQVQTDPNFMLTDEELDEVNTVVLNKKYNEFEKAFPMYKNIDPLDKAVMYSAYYLGGLTREKNPYTTFMKIYKDTNNITRALKEGIVDRINNPKNYESERATKALNWLASKMPKPKRRPERIQDKPDIRSFLSPQLSA